MKPIDVKDNTYIDFFGKEINDNDPKFKVGDHVLLKKLKLQFHGHMSLMILMVKKLREHFMKDRSTRI